MFTFRICIVTHEEIPRPCESRETRDDLLVKALNDLDIEVDAHPWNETDVDWGSFDLLLCRSTWDFPHKPREFIQWIEENKHLPLCHPAEGIIWTMDKIYLKHFMKHGISVPDTVFVPAGTQEASLKELMMNKNWKTAMVKPRISADGANTFKIDVQNAKAFQPKFEQVILEKNYMVQEFIPEVTEGEWSLIFFGGLYSHSIKQIPGEYLIRSKQLWSREKPSKSMIEFATQVLETVPFDTTYARVDLVPRKSGEYVLIEVELVAPALYLTKKTARTFAATIHKLLL